jgi:hypothetical protein
VAVIGGSTSPGARPGKSEAMAMMPGATFSSFSQNQAIPIADVATAHPTQVTSLGKLMQDGIFTSPVHPMQEIIFATTTGSLPKRVSDSLPRSITNFPAKAGDIGVYSLWVKRAKINKGEISGAVFDGLNRQVFSIKPKRVSLSDLQQIFGFSFSPANLPPGTYRVDLNWNGNAAWRSFVQITE